MLQQVGEVEAVAAPLQVDGERLEHRLPPPRLGEHSAEVLAELGYSEADVQTLVRDGVVGSRP
jgi:crotonobetainyl-CoA:carnitine CoA-transferase CaiB-like acyl-CoA transferase